MPPFEMLRLNHNNEWRTLSLRRLPKNRKTILNLYIITPKIQENNSLIGINRSLMVVNINFTKKIKNQATANPKFITISPPFQEG